MKLQLILTPSWIAVALVAAAVVGCGKTENTSSKTAYTMPEINDANCTSEAIKSMAPELQQKFADQCVRRPKSVQSQKKAYDF